MAASRADQIIVGFLGTSGTGKTTLLERLIPELRGRGVRVGVIKHTSRDFEMDHQGKDTYRFKQAGAQRVVIDNAYRLGLVADLEAAPSFEELVATHFEGCDLVLVEGHRAAGIPKVICLRSGAPRGLIEPQGLENVVAEVSDLSEARFPGTRRFGFDDVPALADFLLSDAPARSGSVAGVVLAGGQSSRLGADKAEVVFEGQTLLERSVRLVSAVCRECWVIGRRPPESLAPLRVNWHLDLVPQIGPLGGILTALKVAQAPRCLVVACDMPHLNEAVLRRLLAAPAEAAAVVARGSEGRPEPLAAVYSAALLPRAEELIQSGNYRLARLFEGAAHFVDFPEAQHFFNVNTPQERAELGG